MDNSLSSFPPSRSFKDRRALIACTRCRHLKKGCKQIGGEKCERCCLTNQLHCVFLDVASDPTAPRPPGSSHTSQPILVPDSPTNPPPPEIPYALLDLDLAHINNNPTFFNLPPSNTNPQSADPSISLSSHADGQFLSYSPLDFIPEQPPLDTTFPHIHGNGVYNYSATQDPIAQPPDPIAPRSEHEQDMTDPSHSPPYLRPRFRQEPVTRHDVLGLPIAYSPIHAEEGIGPSPVPLPDFPTTSNNSDHNVFFGAPITTRPSNPSIDDTSVSSYDLPCLFCSFALCRLHLPEYTYRWDDSDDEMT